MSQKNDWYIWGEWPGIPWFHWCSIFGLALELGKRSGVSLSALAVDYRDGTATLYLLKHEWEGGGARYLHEIVKHPQKLEQDVRAVERAASDLFRLNQRLLQVQPARCSRQKLAQLCEHFHEVNHELWASGMVLNLLELNQSYLSSYLRKHVEAKRGQSLSPQEWQVLITPTKLSYAQQEERAFLQLVVMLSKNRKLQHALRHCQDDVAAVKHVLQRFPSALKKVHRHWKKFCWIQYGWTGPATTLEYYLDLLVRLIKSGNARVLLNKTLREDHSLSKSQRMLEQSLKLGQPYQRLLTLLRRLLFGKTYRMDALYQGYFAFEPFLREIAKRFLLSMNQIYMVYLGDLAYQVRKGRFNVVLLNSAQKYSAFIKEGKQLQFYVGDVAEKKMVPILRALPRIKMAREVQGECGYPGKVKGRVTRIDTAKDMHKIKEGDILVSHATDPSLLPAMKKAAAFVTDLGGLTAHAAIVAREMKKPCVIGTRIVTHIFKDGDRVEVDATKGIVRKI